MSKNNTPLDNLIGQAVKSVWLDGNKEAYLTFETDHGKFHYSAEGDCCSFSYFAEILNVHNLLGGSPVASVEEMEFQGEPQSLPRDESVKVYGFRLIFEDDTSTPIIFRNSSNGYYGGWMGPCSEKYIPDTMRQITSDFRAE